MTTLSRENQAAIDAAVETRRQDLIELIQDLVRIPSVTGNEGALQAYVSDRMSKEGYEVDVWEPSADELAPHAIEVGEFDSLAGRPNVVGVWRGSGAGSSLILNAHIDVVHEGLESNWTHPPYGGDLVDGKIYGRGSCDMKSGLATHLIAVQALKDVGFAPGGDVIVESVISEEDGGAGTLATILRGYTADGALITEPTDLELLTAHGGSLVFRITIRGLSAHGASRDEGVSAVEKYIPIHLALLDLEARRNAEIDHPLYAEIANKIPISVGTVEAGDWHSTVPELLVATGRAGLVPGETLEEIMGVFVDTVMAAAAADPWLAVHPPIVEFFSGQFSPSEISVDHTLARAVQQAHREVTGNEVPVIARPYGTDMRHFINTGEIPCVIYGAGNALIAHQSDEHIEVDDVVKAAKVVAHLIGEWCA